MVVVTYSAIYKFICNFSSEEKSTLNNKKLFCFLCCVPADAGHALCLRGALQEESWPGVWAAGHNQQLRMKDAASQQSTQQHKKKNKQELHRTCPH